MRLRDYFDNSFGTFKAVHFADRVQISQFVLGTLGDFIEDHMPVHPDHRKLASDSIADHHAGNDVIRSEARHVMPSEKNHTLQSGKAGKTVSPPPLGAGRG